MLIGDGIHNDAPDIQALLDTHTQEVVLPAPEKEYAIASTLRLHSGQTLRLGTTARIVLLPGSNCPMITNAEKDSHDIAVIGGIWDYQNTKQAPNPIKTIFQSSVPVPTHFDGNPDTVIRYNDAQYLGVIFRFCGVTRLTIRGLTLKDPVTFCIQIACITHFTIENINFDQNFGNPSAENMDGIHVDGNCRFGLIRNVQGTCYDDIVALNADDFYDGPIEDIQIDGIMGANSLRGVRLLSLKSPVRRISISDVFGTFYQNAVGLTYFYPFNGNRGTMDAVVIRNIFAENAPRRPEYNKSGPYSYALIWIDGNLDIGQLRIENVYRHERIGVVETLKICEGAKIKRLTVSNLEHRNETGTPIPVIRCEGDVGVLHLCDIETHGDALLVGNGKTEKLLTE